MRIFCYLILYPIFFLILPFYFAGLIEKVKSIWAGRKGKPLFQPLYDFQKLIGKGQVISSTTSWLFQFAPLGVLGAVLVAAFLTPLGGFASPLSFTGDIVVFSYLLGLSRFLSILSALDTGSSFEGMGAARESSYGMLVEPALFIFFGALVLFSGNVSFTGLPHLAVGPAPQLPLAVGSSVILFILLLVEGCRVPFDDPNTHLELTMIHEVMALDNSGPDLAIYNYSSYLKMTVFANLIAVLVLTPLVPFWTSVLLSIPVISLVAIIAGIVESVMARLRLQNIPQLLLGTSGLALILFIFIMLGGTR